MSRTLFLEAYCRARLVLTNLSVDDGQLPKPVGKARRWESSEEAVDGRTVFASMPQSTRGLGLAAAKGSYGPD